MGNGFTLAILFGLVAIGIASFGISITGFVIYSNLNFATCCLPKMACSDTDAMKKAINSGVTNLDWYTKAVVGRDETTGLCILFGESPLLSDFADGNYGCSSDLALNRSLYPDRGGNNNNVDTSSWAWNTTCVPDSTYDCSKDNTDALYIGSSCFLLFIGVACLLSFVIFIRGTPGFLVAAAFAFIVFGVITLGTAASAFDDGNVQFQTADKDNGKHAKSAKLEATCSAPYADTELYAMHYLLPFPKGSSGPTSTNVYSFDKMKWLLILHITIGCVSVVFGGLIFPWYKTTY